MKRFSFALLLFALLVTSSAAAAVPRVSVEEVECLLVEENAVIKAHVESDVPGSVVRLYFRRLHEEVEDFYWVEMQSKGQGDYWGVLPKPADEALERRELQRLTEQVRERWAMWWREKERLEDRNPNEELDQTLIDERANQGRAEPRNWMLAMADSELEEFLAGLEYEPTEYFAAAYDGFSQRIARSAMKVTQVRSDCQPNLTPAEAGLAENLTVGETAVWQRSEEVFHWLCDGVVSRVGANGVWRGDALCRACIIGWWRKPNYLLPIAAGSAGSAAGIRAIDDTPPEEISPSRPPGD